ncbi:hypothetical protein RFI_31557 [Reticulomyxa filosa]|uniref:Uncharacterized protein n=1 Tax=Reticulomyxa filosa TaxID=46433 RepID=X6LV90_RETFI|nr:hypothetical protein RFI_31557 [Reticulomyxa filosa]|eukprot:ETO05838.1 hypothetical protein RFI_31557 [Reticulomyxa filosa]
MKDDESVSVNASSSSFPPSASQQEDRELELKHQQKEEGFQYLLKVVEWLQEQEFSQLPLVRFEAAILPKEVIAVIEKEADAYSYYTWRFFVSLNRTNIRIEQTAQKKKKYL